MNEKKEPKIYTKKNLLAAFWVLLFFFAILGIVAPATHLWFVDFIPSFVLGLLGYYAFWPFFIVLSIYMLFFRKTEKRFAIIRLSIGYAVVVLGTASLLSHIASEYQASFGALDKFFEAFWAANDNFGAGFFNSLPIGGGFLGYLLASTFNLLGHLAYGYLFSIIFICVGLILIFFPLIAKFFRFLSSRIAIRKAKGSKEEPSLEDSNLEEPQENIAEEISEQPKLIESSPVEMPSRRSLREETPEIEEGDFTAPMSRSGLQKATFSFIEPSISESMSEPSFEEQQIGEPKPEDEEADPRFEDLVLSSGAPIPTTDIDEMPLTEASFDAEEEPLISEPIIPVINKEPESAVEEKPIQEEKPALSTPKPSKKVEDEWIDFNGIKQRKAKRRPSYTFPTTSGLYEYPDDKNAKQNESDGVARSEKINQAFVDLGVGAHVEGYTIGPSVTRFNIVTDKNVSVSAIKKVVDDVMVRLGGVLGFFHEVVPGSSASGLEIPNRVQSIVSFKETIEAMPTGDKYNLVVPFGKSIEGKVVFADLADFPHMLVSGSTGSGKSIFVHSLIMSLIMRNRPEDLKLVLIDPKRVEMGKYRDIPHLLCQIIKEPSEAKVCFDKLVDEMERRYSLLENTGVSNIRQFNKDIAPKYNCEKLPFIIVFIDEYADLVDCCKDIAEPVGRIAQKARAAGIHLVVTTQRPDVNVINGRIKSNIAVRVALSLSSAVDSGIVLGEGGAEKLSGHGDMLVKCDQISRIGFSRLQGCFVDNGEILSIVESIKAQQQVHYDPNFIDLTMSSPDIQPMLEAPSAAQLKAASDEDKYLMIREAIMSRDFTSISQIQREFGVGFPRAGRIFARLQAEGIVERAGDTSNNSKGARVIVHNVNDIKNPGSLSQSQMIDLPESED